MVFKRLLGMSGWDENLQPQQAFAHKIEDLQVCFGKKQTYAVLKTLPYKNSPQILIGDLLAC